MIILKSYIKKFRGLNQISFSTFCKLLPLWMVKAQVSDRDTCLRIQHENMVLIISALPSNNIINYNTSSRLLSSITCSQWTEDCLLRTCKFCCNKSIVFNNIDEKFLL